MKFSSETDKIFSAMTRLQSNITNPARSADNPFFKSKYTPLDVMIDHVTPHLSENGLSVSQFPCSGDNGVGVITVIMHTSGQFIESDPFYLSIAKSTPQEGGSAITYARRYALAACLNIASDTDDDGNKPSGKRKYKGKDDKTEAVKCAKCNKDIEDTYDKSGALWPAEDIVQFSQRRYKAAYCPDCQKEIHKQTIESENKTLSGKSNGTNQS